MVTHKPTRTHQGVEHSKDGNASGSKLSHTRCITILVSILTLACAVRTAMLVDFVRSNPVAGMPDGDAAAYWEMAGRIAAGDWIDDKPFLSVPLYPYALAVVRALGGGLTTVYVLQLLIHLATGGLIAHLTAQKFGRAAGLIALGVFVLLQEPAFLSTRLLPSTFQLLLVTGTLLAAQRFQGYGGLGNAALVGVMTGLLALIYPPAMILVPLLLPWMTMIRAAVGPGPRTFAQAEACGSGGESSRRLKPAARWRRRRSLAYGALASGMACLTILPATWHNWMACGEIIPITAHAGITFRHGNAPGSDGTYTTVEGVSPARQKMHLDTARVYASQAGRTGSYGQISRYFFTQGLDYLASDLGRASRLAGRKLYWFLTGRHYSDIYYPSLEQADGWVNLLFLAPLPTAWLMGPAVVGLIGLCRETHTAGKPVPHLCPASVPHSANVPGPCRFHAMDWALLLLPILIVITFWYSPRYRLPALPMLVVASAGAVGAAWQAIATRTTRVDGMDSRALSRRLQPARVHEDRGHNGDPCVARAKAHGSVHGGIAHAKACGSGWGVLAVFFAASIATGPINTAIGFDRAEDFRPRYECNRGHVYALLGQYDSALERFIKSDRLQPDRPLVLAAMAESYIRLARFGEAQRTCRRLVEVDPDSVTTWLAGGSLHCARGQWSDAQTAFEKCLKIDPLDAEAHWGMWLTLSSQNRVEEGVANLRQVVRLDPAHAAAASEYGIWLAQDGRLQEAEYYLRRARRLSPLQPEAHYNLGMMLMEAGRADEAAECFSHALRLEPQYLQAQRALRRISAGSGLSQERGQSAQQQRPRAESIAALEEQIERRPDDASLYSRLAGMHYARGDAQQATAVLRKAVTQAKEPDTAAVELAWLLATSPDERVRNGQEAVGLVLDVLGRMPEPAPEYLDVFAAALAESGEFDRAAQEARRAAAIATQQGREGLSETIRRRADLYKSRRPFRQLAVGP